jgi:hypothetical protein
MSSFVEEWDVNYKDLLLAWQQQRLYEWDILVLLNYQQFVIEMNFWKHNE